MMTFLKQLAIHVKNSNQDLKHLTIVLPSRRAIKYLRAELASAYKKPILSPQLVTIDELIKATIPQPIIDKTHLLVVFYNVYGKHEIEPDNFDEFLNWAPTILADFEEIDRYLIDANQLFKNLADVKELESWNVEPHELTSAQKKFLLFWEKLPTYYKLLNDELNSLNTVYSGQAFKRVAENPEWFFQENKDAKYLFAGFNALSESEITIINGLQKLGRAEYIIDSDEFYLSKKHHEAGRFIRKNMERLEISEIGIIGTRIQNKPLKIQLIASTELTGQVKIAATKLSELNSSELDETLLLLADESLINSIIRNIPMNVGKANITLGLPLQNTAVSTWIDLIFSIQENKISFHTNALYFKDVFKIFSHPFILLVTGINEQRIMTAIESHMRHYNTVFTNLKELKGVNILEELCDLLRINWENDWKLAVETIKKINELLFRSIPAQNRFDKALIQSFAEGITRFENLIAGDTKIPEMSLKSFKKLFAQHWHGISIAFHGNPITGLQIMGLLESRCLDFKRIICLGMNEGSLPPTNPINTVIPMDLRRYFGLPTPRDKQGLFAHHFYRLLHHCEDLTITYCNGEEQLGRAEQSRYITQLMLELEPSTESVQIDSKIYNISPVSIEHEHNFSKSPEILDRINQILTSSVSASMLNKYLDCPLDFYFKYVLDFGESQEVEDEIENNTFGTFVHETLEELYLPFSRLDSKGEINPNHRALNSDDIIKMRKDFPIVLESRFRAHFDNKQNSFKYGVNRLSFEMAKEMIDRFLKNEQKFIESLPEPLFIEALEIKLSQPTQLEINGEHKTINLTGTIDRVDRIGNQWRIIDYKSGKCKDEHVSLRVKDLSVDDVIESVYNTNKKYILQLMLYAYLYQSVEKRIAIPGIMSFISKSGSVFNLNGQKLELEELITMFPKILESILSEMCDSEINFEHREKQISYCKYCV